MTTHYTAALATMCVLLAAAPVAAHARGVSAHYHAISHEGDGWLAETGTASFYGPSFHGRLTADGSRFDQGALTAAHSWLPFGTKVRVTMAETGRTVVVTITDRMPSSRRVVDLSVAAARHLGFIGRGLAEVTLAPA